jgi:methyltransferase (TIGR00027 family)
MTSEETRIEHVGDTALMVAGCRALENERADALVRDPYAARVAGERGMAIARGIPNLGWLQFGVGIRSHFIDALIPTALEGIETVVILGAGLDTRPWRLDLPAGLRWIEVDFPEMLDYKADVLGSETPRCRVERLAADLNDSAQRGRIFDAVGPEPALMITEGLLDYLPAQTVEALATESAARCGVRRWLLNIHSTELSRRTPKGTAAAYGHLVDKDRLSGEAILAMTGKQGWTQLEYKNFRGDAWAVASQRIIELVPDVLQNPQRTAITNDPSGVYLLGRSSTV